MKKMLLLAFVFLPICLYSGETRTVTCDQAVNLALANNLDILQAQKDVAIASAQLGQSYAGLFMPSISGSGSFNYSGSSGNQPGYQTTNIAGQDYVIANQYPDSYSAGVSVSKTLFSGFQLWNAKEVQQRNFNLAQWNYRASIETNKVSTVQTFYQVLLLAQNIRVQELSDKSLKDRLDYMTGLYNKGRTNELDYLQAVVNFRSNSPKLIQARNDYASAKQNLCLMIGLTNSESVEFTGTLSDITNSFTNGTVFTNMVNNALSNDSSLRSIETSLETAMLNKSTSDLAILPSLSGNFGYRFDFKKDPNSFGNRTWQPSWNAGLSLDIPVESWFPFSKEAQTSAQNNSTVEKLLLSRTQRVQNVIAALQNSLMNIKQLQDTADSQTDTVLLAKRQLELSRQQNRMGNINPLDLQDAEVSYRQAEQAYWQAFYNYSSAALALRSMTRDGGTKK